MSKSCGTYDLLLSQILNIRFCDNRNARVIGCVRMIRRLQNKKKINKNKERNKKKGKERKKN